MTRTQLALEIAAELGFDLAGVAELAPPPAAARFTAWLAAGRHASMAWLERDRARILDPARLLPAGRSILVVGLGHARAPVELPGGARLARYAAGRDYHNVLGKRLQKLARRLEDAGLVGDWRKVVDAGPLLERSHAAAAGLGFESKAANLLAPRLGPWFFLGELVVDAELAPTPTPPPGSCGTCTACLDACPTHAILAPGEVDARRCVSYLTIEHAGPIDRELRAGVGPWLFGCDVCSEVCPWGHDAPDLAARFGTHAALERGDLLARWLAPDFDPVVELEGSPVRRPGREGLARNAATVLGNLPPTDAGRAALDRALDDASPTVREAAAWSLAHAYDDARARDRLARLDAADPRADV
ncbi:MAG: tRNA epoxyqueuosine(34) reductase QueG [Planctomycetes bacterium]|nr:tRNA epoxyqueuosine(34) reductase QueG [Planctomycetota bacterium]